MEKVQVCHYDADTDTWKTISINENALLAHLNHGDEMGMCGSTSEAVFLDSPVEGLTYTSGSLSGKTDSTGKFEYENNNTVSFNVGGIFVGEIDGNDIITPIITPIDLVDNGDINDQTVRNIASFFQSLDDDSNPSNGILISTETDQALSNSTLDFTSDNFLIELTALIEEINTANSSSLTVVNSNDAALHLAVVLNLQSEYEFLPRVIEGREWEEGEYFGYFVRPDGEYIFKIGSDLNGVKYNFTGNLGYYGDFVYEQGKLSGFGNLYFDINSDPPVTPVPNREYSNRIGSPGYVFDYNGDTFLGWYNYFKTTGDPGKLQGVYQSYYYFDRKNFNEDPSTLFISKIEVEIDEPNLDGDFPLKIIQYDADNNIRSEENKIIDKEDVNNENILLIRFQDTDYIFINKDKIPQYFQPGLLTIKG